jgi:hypothetical protein
MAAGRSQTRKAKKALKVDSSSKIPELEKLLKSGKLTVILVYADWCGACQRFKKDIWEPMCKKPASNNRAAVRDDVLNETSLRNAKIQYLPSVIVVDENGNMSEQPGPRGEMTNAVPTPKNLAEMNAMVNATPGQQVGQTENITEDPIPKYLPTKEPDFLKTGGLEPLAGISVNTPGSPSGLTTPAGTVYEPSPQVVSPLTIKQQGGGLGGLEGGKLLRTLRSIALGNMRQFKSYAHSRTRRAKQTKRAKRLSRTPRGRR